MSLLWGPYICGMSGRAVDGLCLLNICLPLMTDHVCLMLTRWWTSEENDLLSEWDVTPSEDFYLFLPHSYCTIEMLSLSCALTVEQLPSLNCTSFSEPQFVKKSRLTFTEEILQFIFHGHNPNAESETNVCFLQKQHGIKGKKTGFLNGIKVIGKHCYNIEVSYRRMISFHTQNPRLQCSFIGKTVIHPSWYATLKSFFIANFQLNLLFHLDFFKPVEFYCNHAFVLKHDFELKQIMQRCKVCFFNLYSSVLKYKKNLRILHFIECDFFYLFLL